MTHEISFGERLLQILKKKKLSQLKVARALDISRTAVNKWTKGGMIDDSNLDKLATFLEVDKIWLKYGEYLDTPHSVSTLNIKNINELHLQQSTEIVTWEWDILTGDVHYSDNVEQVYGIKITGNQDFLSLMSDDSKARLSKEYTNIIQNGGAHEIDFKINLDTGESRWITSRATGITGPNGKITKLIGISLNNTARKQNEIKFRKFKQYFDLLLQDHPNLIVFIDQSGEIIISNGLNKKVDFGEVIHSNDLDKDTDFFNLQRFLYNLAIEEKAWINEICHKGQGSMVFQGRTINAVHGLDEEGKVFLMLEIQAN